MEPLAQLQDNVHSLLTRISELEQEVASLREKEQENRQEIIRAHGELAQMQDKYRKLQLSSAMLGDEEQRAAAKTHITNMIAQLDRAIDVLRQ